jgi:inner membrane protein
MELGSKEMDNLTHTLFGAVLGEAGLKRRTPLAMPVLLIGANLPDLDIIAAFTGHSLSFRRGWTHGALALVILPLLLAGTALLWDRWRRRKRPGGGLPPGRPVDLVVVSFVAVLSHPFLDWLNNYGLRWLMPFDGTWFYGDALFIIDPWLWALLLGGFVLARSLASTRVGAVVLSMSLTYFILMLATAAYGRAFVARELGAQGIVPDAVMVGPVPIDATRRQVIVRQGDIYRTGQLTWTPRPELLLDERRVPSNHDHPAVAAAVSIPEVRRFLEWARYPFFVVDRVDEGYSIRADDLRYSDRARGSFATVRVSVPLAESTPGSDPDSADETDSP